MKTIQIILSVIGILYLIDLVWKTCFNGKVWSDYEEEKEKRFPRWGL